MDFDLFVIGAGSGGVRASRLAAQTGAKVAVAEEKYLGGTCVNVGCVPKKLFYYGSHYHDDFAEAAGFGWSYENLSFDWPTLRDRKNAEIARLNSVYQKILLDAGVNIIEGRATILDAHTLEVGGKTYTAEKILIAAGGAPHVPEFEGSELVMTSDDVFYMDKLPKRALVVGGGYIAVEFAGIFNGMGVETELVYRRDQLLRQFDASIGQHIAREMASKGIQISFNHDVESIQASSDGLQVTFKSGEIRVFDAVLYATGRKPLSHRLFAGDFSIDLNPDGTIIVDDYFQSSQPEIFALGDIIGTPELTPVALAQGIAFVDTWFKGDRRTVDYDNIATAVFSQPNVGTVGLTEQMAREKYEDILVYQSEFRHLKHTLSGSDEKTLMKILVDKASDAVVGVHMVGAEAGEIIQGIAIAIKAGATKAVFDQTIGIHPTAAEEFVTMREPITP